MPRDPALADFYAALDERSEAPTGPTEGRPERSPGLAEFYTLLDERAQEPSALQRLMTPPPRTKEQNAPGPFQRAVRAREAAGGDEAGWGETLLRSAGRLGSMAANIPLGTLATPMQDQAGAAVRGIVEGTRALVTGEEPRDTSSQVDFKLPSFLTVPEPAPPENMTPWQARIFHAGPEVVMAGVGVAGLRRAMAEARGTPRARPGAIPEAAPEVPPAPLPAEAMSKPVAPVADPFVAAVLARAEALKVKPEAPIPAAAPVPEWKPPTVGRGNLPPTLEEAAPAPQAAPMPGRGNPNLPQWLDENIGRYAEQADRAKLTPEIERLSREGRTAREVYRALKPGFDTAKIGDADARIIIRSVRARGGIKAADEAADMPTPPIVPEVAPEVGLPQPPLAEAPTRPLAAPEAIPRAAEAPQAARGAEEARPVTPADRVMADIQRQAEDIGALQSRR